MGLRIYIVVFSMAVMVANGSPQGCANWWPISPLAPISSGVARMPPPPQPQPPFVLYETRSLEKIWDNCMSGRCPLEPCSIWRVDPPFMIEPQPPLFPVGDIAVMSLTEPSFAYVVGLTDLRAHIDALKIPDSYTEIWNNKGSSAVSNVTIWRVNCTSGYEALGNVATTNGTYPLAGSIYCVKRKYVLLGSNTDWSKVWDNSGSGADNVTIYEARTSTHKQQTVYGIGAIASYEGYPGTPYFLNKDYIKKPIPMPPHNSMEDL